MDDALVEYNQAVRFLTEGIGHYDEAARRFPNPQAHYRLGRALSGRGQIPTAITQLEYALRLKPDFADAHYELGYCYLEQNNVSRSISELQTAVRLDPRDGAAHGMLGRSLDRAGKTQEAAREYREACKLSFKLACAELK